MKRYLPAVVLLAFAAGFALFGILNHAHAASPPTPLRLCTGKSTGNYFKAGLEMEKQGHGAIEIQVIETAGSMENLNKIEDGSCDAAIVQSDAYLVFKKQNPKSDLDLERAAGLYEEFAHLICNRASGVTRVTQLTPKTPVAIGPLGSGSSVTWDGFVLADPKTYKDIPTLPIDGIRALKKVAEGSDATCMLYVAGLKTAFMSGDVNGAGDKVVLAKADDGDMDKIRDPKKKPVYAYESIPGGTYPKIQDGLLGTSVKTIATTALVVVNSKWIDGHDRDYEAFLKAENKAEPAIKAIVTPN